MLKTNKVLVVDDEPSNRLLLEHVLSNEGLEVVCATSGQECLDLAETADPNLILLDIMMPGMSGFEVCGTLKKYPKTTDIPIVFVTALSDLEYVQEAQRIGGTDYITKPLDLSEVTTRVNNVLTNQQLAKDKLNLLRLNGAMLERIRDFLDGMPQLTNLDRIKDDLNQESTSIMNCLQGAQSAIDAGQAGAATVHLNQAILALQFADRVGQQLNEFAKVIREVHDITNGEESADGSKESMMRSSTSSVINKKTDQADVDDLLESLGI